MIWINCRKYCEANSRGKAFERESLILRRKILVNCCADANRTQGAKPFFDDIALGTQQHVFIATTHAIAIHHIPYDALVNIQVDEVNLRAVTLLKPIHDGPIATSGRSPISEGVQKLRTARIPHQCQIIAGVKPCIFCEKRPGFANLLDLRRAVLCRFIRRHAGGKSKQTQ